MRRSTLAGVAIFVVAVAVRLLYLFTSQPYHDARAGEMERAAQTLARQGILGDVYGPGTGPSAHVAPLYAVGLAAVYSVCGTDGPSGRLTQDLLALLASSGGIALLPLVARKAGLDSAPGFLAAALLAVLPLNLSLETSGAWEQPYAVLALLALLLAFVALRRREWRSGRLVLVTGFLLGGSALLSPALLPAGGLMFLAELAAQPGARARVLRAGLVMAGVCVLVLTPWTVRNYAVLGGLVPLRSNFGLELALGNHPGANGKTYETSPADPDCYLYRHHPFADRAERTRLVGMGELPYMREQGLTARRWIEDHPAGFAALTAERVRLFWFPPSEMWTRPSLPVPLLVGVFGLLGAGTFCGLGWLALRRHPSAGLLAAAVLGTPAVYMVTHVDLRYRYPLFGLSALLTCAAAVRAGQWLRERVGRLRVAARVPRHVLS
jgi:hypothetical protein